MDGLIPIERNAQKIYLIRGQKVMLDSDLAEFYGVKTGHLTRQVRSNIDSFPHDFMFILNRREYSRLRCQIGTLDGRGKYSKYLPYVFTELGVAMLSSVLKIRQCDIWILLYDKKIKQHENSINAILGYILFNTKIKGKNR